MQAQQVLSAGKRFHAWWIKELGIALTPRRADLRSWQTLLLYRQDGLEIVVKQGTSSRSLGILAQDASASQIANLRKRLDSAAGTQAKRVLLRLSADDVLERTIQIPKAALDVVEPVLRNQMERIVPWPQEEARYAYRLAGANAQNPDQFDVEVAATKRSILDDALARAKSLDLTPYAIDFAPSGDPRLGMVLLPLEADPAEKMASRLQILLALLFIASAGIGAAGVYQLLDRRAQAGELETQIAAASAQVAEVERLNQENARLREQRERLVNRKRDDPPIVVLIEALSRTLPDNAYLTELQIENREVRMVGKSDNPTALITLLENTPQFNGVSFSAPTVREKNEEIETFSIVASAGRGELPETKR